MDVLKKIYKKLDISDLNFVGFDARGGVGATPAPALSRACCFACRTG